MITKWYRIKCDECAFSEQWPVMTVVEAIILARQAGWRFKRLPGKHYCSKSCADKKHYWPKDRVKMW